MGDPSNTIEIIVAGEDLVKKEYIEYETSLDSWEGVFAEVAH